jgi:hypothetical protein
MADLTAQRTLVKSPPELWSELSEVESLARHLGELGEIRITRVEPESTVAWEGERVSGTVELEQSGWGTKVTFHATVPEPDPAPEPDPEPVAVEPEPVAVAEPEPTVNAEPEPEPDAKPKRTGFFARWLFRDRRPIPEPVVVAPEPVAAEPEPVAVEPEPVAVIPEPAAIVPEPDPEPDNPAAERVQQVLDHTLDALGQAHHRPFSRG